MQSGQLITPQGQAGRYKQPREPKVYHIPPPPASILNRSGGRGAGVSRNVPIYSHSNNSYSPENPITTTTNASNIITGGNTKTSKYQPPSRGRSDSADSAFSNSSSATLTSSSRDPSPGSLKGHGGSADPVPTSRYIHMLLSIDSIPKIYNLLAAFSTWILLAGYVLLPGTFTSLQNMPAPVDPSDPDYDPSDPPNAIQTWFLERVRNTPLLYVASACSALGVLGMCLLWFRWRANYVWIINRIFLPGTLNSLAGVISTIVNVHTAQEGKYSLTAIVTITVTAVSTVVNGMLWLVYNNWALKRVQDMHAREYFGEKEGGRLELGESGGLVEVQEDTGKRQK